MKQYVEQILEERAYDIRDMKVLRLARRLKLASPVAYISIDEDDDGNKLNSKYGGVLRVRCPAIPALSDNSYSYVYLGLNNLPGSSYWTNKSLVSVTMYLAQFSNTLSTVRVAIDVIDNNIDVIASYGYRNSILGSTGIYAGGTTVQQEAVKSLQFTIATGPFPAGMIIEWYEYV